MWMRDVHKFMQINYNDRSVIRDLEKTRSNYESFMGDKLKTDLRVKFDQANNKTDLRNAIEQILLEEWPITRRATLFSHKQREDNYQTYLQDLRLNNFQKYKICSHGNAQTIIVEERNQHAKHAETECK